MAIGNGAAAHLVAAIVDPSLLAENVNYLRVAFHPLAATRWIVNWDEVSRSLLETFFPADDESERTWRTIATTT
jgi:exonuclease V gamma subunit